MLGLQRVDRGKFQNNTASMARNRLMGDPVMRRNRAVAAPSLPPSPVTKAFPALAPTNLVVEPRHDSRQRLTASEQRTQVLVIARNFANHYLAEIKFLADRNITVALVQPSPCANPRKNPPHRISVDAHGNAEVKLFRARRNTPPRHIAALNRLAVLLTSLFVVLALATLLFSLL
jgi:hypothetical protein